MKTLILYATKYGAAREIAQRIAKEMPEAVICNLKEDDIPQLSEFDCIILGSSLYAGMIRKEAKEFMTQNIIDLCHRKLGLYISGLESKNESTYFESNFPDDILKAATAKMFAGGIYDPDKVGFIGRFVMKKIANQTGFFSNISDEKIKKFTNLLKQET